MIPRCRFIANQSTALTLTRKTQMWNVLTLGVAPRREEHRRSASEPFLFLFSRVPPLMCGLFMRGGGAVGAGELVMQYGSNEKEINTACSVKHVTPPTPCCILTLCLLLAAMQLDGRAHTHTHTNVRACNPSP